MMAQTGDPTGTGEGGESSTGEPIKAGYRFFSSNPLIA